MLVSFMYTSTYVFVCVYEYTHLHTCTHFRKYNQGKHRTSGHQRRNLGMLMTYRHHPACSYSSCRNDTYVCSSLVILKLFPLEVSVVMQAKNCRSCRSGHPEGLAWACNLSFIQNYYQFTYTYALILHECIKPCR